MYEVERHDSGFLEKLSKLHMPPSGGDVERGRMKFYLDRAAATRLPAEALLNQQENLSVKSMYRDCMDNVFARRDGALDGMGIQPARIDLNSIWSGISFNGAHLILKREVFDRAFDELNEKSNPGYPSVYEYASNADLNKDILYETVSQVLRKWLSCVYDWDRRRPDQMDSLQLFKEGLSWPVMVFVKMEPTGESKIARLIYGVSVVMNIIGRIFFGDILRELPYTVGKAQHEVGIDMETEDGLNCFDNGIRRVFKMAHKKELFVESSDVQGWEYMVREWMNRAWYASLVKRRVHKKDEFTKRLIAMYCLMEAKALAIDSDGYVHQLPFCIMCSGRPTTHVANSDMRDALADTILAFNRVSVTLEDIPSDANGDDCIEVSFKGKSDIYENLGFVVTDRLRQTPDEIRYCSQILRRGADGKLVRMPDSLAKSFFNAMNEFDSEESLMGIFSHIRNHPGRKAFGRGLLWAARLNELRCDLELPFELE